ncbi:MAG: phosphoribosylformylglycinamidine cyclo-ligase [Candidatus Izemoplasma sp.]|nr:phosphoribosylformylglycinamidine cyclo-ligase [Candidatus Izemoplasma sp.]
MSKQYEAAGVSLNKGYDTIKRIQKHTHNIGDFGGLFDLSQFKMTHPILVSGTDGIGTKLAIAKQLNKHDTIGIDLVAMCANDIITKGARPLFFLDYFATSYLKPFVVEEVIKGIVKGCQLSNAILIGGETAEMPDMYQQDDYDIAGFMVGIVDKDNMIDKNHVKAGDMIIGLPSSGIHSNGYSLVRKILFKDNNIALSKQIGQQGKTLKEILLTPTKLYVNPVLSLVEHINIHSIAHITGGGFYENIPRALPDDLGVIIDSEKLPNLPIYNYLQDISNVDKDEMYHVFNMGIGMILIIDPSDETPCLDILRDEDARVIGHVTHTPGVTIR